MRTRPLSTLCVAASFVLMGSSAALAVETSKEHAVPGEISTAAAVHPEPAQAMRLVKLPKDTSLSVWAAEPQLQNPVGLTLDEKGRVFVAETLRYREGGVIDNRHRVSWLSDAFKKKAGAQRLATIDDEMLDRELAARTVEDRVAWMTEYTDSASLRKYSERVRLLEDTNGDGKADRSMVFAEGFNDLLDGIGSAVMAWKGDVFFANIPRLWRLRDTNGDGKADLRKSMSYGYGVRFAFTGHDLHGLRLGPDGRLYYSNGDRGSNLYTPDGQHLANPDSGTVFRCELDGSNLEMFATGLRNPQDLAFDDAGNLFTGDNNSDGGDQARIVYVVEGGDSGWRIGYQYIETPVQRGPWNAQKMWHPPFKEQSAHLVPPIMNLTNGPSGLTHYPGTGFGSSLDGKFLIADFKGQNMLSGIWSFGVKQKGAGFEVTSPEKFLWNLLVTDMEFGPDGALYIADWLQGWLQPGKGRVFKLAHAQGSKDPLTAETKSLLSEGPDKRSEALLITQLGHVDARVRLDAQLELVRRGADGPLVELATQAKADSRTRMHAIWALGQRLRRATGDGAAALARPVISLLEDPDAEVRAQAAKVVGDAKVASAFDALVRRLSDREPRPRFFAAVALGRLADRRAFTPAVALLRANADRDPYLRHAAVMALVGSADVTGLVALAKDKSAAVRRGAVVTLRRLRRPELKIFLDDLDPVVARDAAEAINDSGLDEALPALAEKTALALHDAPVGFRVVNALFRQGNKAGALALAGLAANEKALAPVREAALRALGDYPKPSVRDLVTGLYHPVKKSEGRVGVAEDAVMAQLPKLLGAVRTPDGVRIAAVKVVGRLNLSAASPLLAAAIARKGLSAAARTEFLRMLAFLGGPEIANALKVAAKDDNPSVRSEALRLQISTAPAEALPLFENAIMKGTIAEKQAALRSVAGLPAGRTDELMVQLLDAYVAGKFAPEAGLELIEGAQQRKAESVAAALKKVESARPQDDLGPYREALVGGDVNAGRKVFFSHQQVQCLRCHKVNGTGGDVGPDLSHAARNQKATYLLEGIAKPSAQFAKGFESVVLTLNDSSIHAGTVVKDEATVLQIVNPDNVTEKINKADIKKREAGASGMPDGFADILTRRELRDLVAFLTTLK